jgi:hypothetical protein
MNKTLIKLNLQKKFRDIAPSPNQRKGIDGGEERTKERHAGEGQYMKG